MIARLIVALVGVSNLNLAGAFANDRKAHSIGSPFLRQATASAGVSQVAPILQLIVTGGNAAVTRSTARAAPGGSKRQTLRMRKAKLHQLVFR